MIAQDRDPIQLLSGWGRYPEARCRVRRPEKMREVAAAVEHSGGSSILARGAGRSYGDASLNSAGLTLLMGRLNRMLAFDAATGVLRCEAGVSLAEILSAFVPRGWFPWITPGTRFVTVGGCFACDVHGKNHHHDGSFSQYVENVQLVTSRGLESCSPMEQPELFRASAGGLGLTGIITEMEMRLRPIETAYIRQRSLKGRDLEEILALLAVEEERHQHSVAWIDCLATGRSLGRGIVNLGDHAALDDLPIDLRHSPLQVSSSRRLALPLDLPSGLLNRSVVSIFNAGYFAQQPRVNERIVSYEPYFYPLDGVSSWNRLYGKNGFMQYQCLFPMETAPQGLQKILQLSGESGRGSFLAVLKRFGAGNGWLSFPAPGYTLALDLPVTDGLLEFLQLLDAVVLDCGGRVYLSKDARLSPQSFRSMYPQLHEWLQVKRLVDPNNLFASGLSRRLNLSGIS